MDFIRVTLNDDKYVFHVECDIERAMQDVQVYFKQQGTEVHPKPYKIVIDLMKFIQLYFKRKIPINRPRKYTVL